MPNTQTSVPAFTAGQVLTAAQMTEVNTGIPVFATTTTRDAAFGGTGEKTLAEGQMAYIENIAGSAAVQYYDGSAWQTLVTGGLALVKTQTIGSGVSSVTVSDVFSATYDNYLILLNDGVASTTSEIKLTLGATATGYYYSGTGTLYSSTAFIAVTGNNATSWQYAATGSANTLSANITVMAPFATKRTMMRASYFDSVTGGSGLSVQGFLNDNTSYTAFTLTPTTGTMTGGTIRVYGYQNS